MPNHPDPEQGPPTPNARGPLPGNKWLIPVPDAADVLGMSERTLRGHLAAGRVPHRRSGGRRWLCWPDDLTEALDGMKQAG